MIYQKNIIFLYTDLLFLTIFFINKKWKTRTLPSWFYTQKYTSYFIVSYAMVLLEEFYAALVNNLFEGFSLSLFIVRIGQFWAFNLLAFSGLIIGVALTHKLLNIKKAELVCFASLFGIFAEHVYTTNSIVFVVYAPIVIFVYYLIFSPGIFFLPEKEYKDTKKLVNVFHYLILLLLVAVVSTLFLLVLSEMRRSTPELFPPCSMIPC
jgi:hypothetical protein